MRTVGLVRGALAVAASSRSHLQRRSPASASQLTQPPPNLPARPSAKVGDAPPEPHFREASGAVGAGVQARAGHRESCSPWRLWAPRMRGLGRCSGRLRRQLDRLRRCLVFFLLQRTETTQYRNWLQESPDAGRPPGRFPPDTPPLTGAVGMIPRDCRTGVGTWASARTGKSDS